MLCNPQYVRWGGDNQWWLNMKCQRNSNIILRGKRLAFLLRHDRNYQFDEQGWREISDLITHHGYTIDELKEIVETNNKRG